MIVNLEGGDTNISLSSLDRIAEALGVTFVDMVRDPDSLSRDLDVVAWRGDDEQSIGVLRSSVAATEEVQLWTWTLGDRATYDASPDPDGWHETILVVSGRLRIIFADTTVTDIELDAGEHTTFSSAQVYSYVNPGTVAVRFVRNVIR